MPPKTCATVTAISVQFCKFNNAKTGAPLIANWREKGRATLKANLFLIQRRLGGRTWCGKCLRQSAAAVAAAAAAK